MSITQEDLNKLSSLAKLDIAEDQVSGLQSSLNDILSMVATIAAADTRDVEPLSNPLDATQVLRADVVTEENQREQLLKVAPETEDGLFLVPQVIE